jgi:hypothetical protein
VYNGWKYHGSLAGDYSFSLNNHLREPISDVFCLVIFYDDSSNAVEVDPVIFRGLIPGGLAKRVSSKVHQSIQEITTPNNSQTPRTKIEIRILDFRLVE